MRRFQNLAGCSVTVCHKFSKQQFPIRFIKYSIVNFSALKICAACGRCYVCDRLIDLYSDKLASPGTGIWTSRLSGRKSRYQSLPLQPRSKTYFSYLSYNTTAPRILISRSAASCFFLFDELRVGSAFLLQEKNAVIAVHILQGRRLVYDALIRRESDIVQLGGELGAESFRLVLRYCTSKHDFFQALFSRNCRFQVGCRKLQLAPRK